MPNPDHAATAAKLLGDLRIGGETEGPAFGAVKAAAAQAFATLAVAEAVLLLVDTIREGR